MKIKLWTLRQSSQVEELLLRKMIPTEAAERVLNVLSTLDKYYGADRDVDHDDGGYLLLYTGCVKEEEVLREVLGAYHVPIEDTELEDILCSGDTDGVWKAVLYLIGNDYGIEMIYPVYTGGGDVE
jgi:hypothetical protein